MRLAARRFTIRSVMIAIGLIAGLLALPGPWQIIIIAFCFPCLAMAYARRLDSQGLLRVAGICFWSLAILINGVYCACSVLPGIHLLLLDMAWLVFVLPTLTGFGVAWARLVSARHGQRRYVSSRAWLSVIALTLMPLVTAATAWPFQMTFLMTRPALESLADRVAAGGAVRTPLRVGPYQIAGTAFDPASGNVGLMIDTNPSGPSGFVRDRSSRNRPFGCFHPFRGDWYHLSLIGGWCYHEED